MTVQLNICFVYLIAHTGPIGTCGPVKVGIAANPEKRLAQLQTGNPSKLDLVFKFATPTPELARHAEGCFHEIAKRDRMNGEWFAISPLKALATLVQMMTAIIAEDTKDREGAIAAMEFCGIFDAAKLAQSMIKPEVAN